MKQIELESAILSDSIFTEKEQRAIDKALKIIDKKIFEREVSFTSPDLVKNYLRLQLEGKNDEHFGVVFLDNQNRLIASEVLFTGTIDAASVFPRSVMKKVLMHNAASIILYHNHPSGHSTPSTADERITDRIKDALNFIDVRVLDHFIVGSGEMTSLAALGKL